MYHRGGVNVFLAGATGALGRPTVRALLAAGHRVRAVVRDSVKAAWARSEGAEPVEVSLFDADALADAVGGCDAVLHFATRIPRAAFRVSRGQAAENDQLRRDASRLLVDAALAAGARVYVQESIAFLYADHGMEWIYEDGRLHRSWLTDSALAAEGETERFSRDGGRGVSLRFAAFYAPYAQSTLDSIRLARLRLFPVPGYGEQFFSSIHVDDAARAALAALDAPAGVYNVCDDEPLSFREYANWLARAFDCKRPRRLPTALTHLLLGELSHVFLLSRRVSNERFKKATGWSPRFHSAREGWQAIARELAAG